MAQTLRKRRLAPETQPADGVAPVPPACIATAFAEPPKPRARDALHPTLLRIVRLLARQPGPSWREMGCTTIEVPLALLVLSLLMMALQALARLVGH